MRRGQAGCQGTPSRPSRLTIGGMKPCADRPRVAPRHRERSKALAVVILEGGIPSAVMKGRWANKGRPRGPGTGGAVMREHVSSAGRRGSAPYTFAPAPLSPATAASAARHHWNEAADATNVSLVANSKRKDREARQKGAAGRDSDGLTHLVGGAETYTYKHGAPFPSSSMRPSESLSPWPPYLSGSFVLPEPRSEAVLYVGQMSGTYHLRRLSTKRVDLPRTPHRERRFWNCGKSRRRPV